MNDAERSKLIKLGNYAMNHMDKTLSCDPPHGTTMPKESIIAIGRDSRKLLILGEILGKDGEKFLARGNKYAASSQLEMPNQNILRMCVAGVVSAWKKRQAADPAFFEKHWKLSDTATMEMFGEPQDNGPMEMKAWVTAELLGMSPSGAANCTFCGSKANTHRVLKSCGRCKAALYCDGVCQKLHWRKEHKAICVAKADGSKDTEKANGSKETEDAA